MVHKKIEPVKNKTTENQNFAGEKSNENVAKSFKHVRDQSGIVLGKFFIIKFNNIKKKMGSVIFFELFIFFNILLNFE